ncbi:uncharacterized protein LOC143514735 isoform X2 [Brachyhypopomus gauderio]|uniref:uncharacterized protein LOC143514735 isoform X2 n=1 Tax=Brachyhypopomus gauderio TaxID=698409 RepID=UPI0040423C42
MHTPVYVTVLLLLFPQAFGCHAGEWSPTAETTNIPEGENATLMCSIHGIDHMFWYRQSRVELTLLISASRGRLGKAIIVNYNKDPAHFVLLPENMSLSITAVGRADVGLYHCGYLTLLPKGGASVHFEKAIHLTLTGALEGEMEGEVEGEVEGALLCRKFLLSAGALLTLTILVCLSMVGCKQGFGVCLRKMCVKDDSSLKVMDVQYASLRLPQKTQGNDFKTACTSVTYDTVAKNFTASPRV